MLDPLLGKALRDLRAQAIGWGLGIGGMLALEVALYPSIAEIYKGIKFPEALAAFVGGELNYTTIEGYLTAEFFSWGMLILSVFAIMSGNTALAGEESDGTLDLLVAQPVSRARLVLVKVASLVIANGAIVLITIPFAWVAAVLTQVVIPWDRLFLALAMLWLFGGTVAIVTMAVSLIMGGGKGSGVVMAIVLVASYILDSLANLVSWLERVRPWLLTVYYQGNAALGGKVDWWYTGGLVAILAAALALTLVLFQRRDLSVQTEWLSGLRLWRRRRAERARLSKAQSSLKPVGIPTPPGTLK